MLRSCAEIKSALQDTMLAYARSFLAMGVSDVTDQHRVDEEGRKENEGDGKLNWICTYLAAKYSLVFFDI